MLLYVVLGLHIFLCYGFHDLVLRLVVQRLYFDVVCCCDCQVELYTCSVYGIYQPFLDHNPDSVQTQHFGASGQGQHCLQE